MALLHYDGFDNYSDAIKITSGKWNSTSFAGGGTGSATVTAAIGIGGTQAMRMHNGSSTADFARLFKTISTASGATFIGQFDLKTSLLPTTSLIVFAPCDTNAYQTTLVINSTGTLSAANGASILGTSSLAISAGTYYNIGFKVVIADSGGTVDIYVNNVNWLNVPSADTKATANASWNSICLASDNDLFNNTNNPDVDFDNLVIMDGTGSAPYQGYLGPCGVNTIFPTGTGNYSQYTPSSAVAHYTLVDETPPNEDTDYVDGVTNTDRDSYTYTVPSTNTILALALDPYAEQTAAGARTYKEFTRISSIDYDNATTYSPGTSYLYNGPAIRTADPATTVTWVGGTKEFGTLVVS